MCARDYRHQAWNSLRGKWGIAIAACLIASLLGGTYFSGNIDFNFDSSDVNINLETDTTEEIVEKILDLPAGVIATMAGALVFLIILALVTSIALFCLGSIIKLGYMRFNLDIIDLKEAKIQSLFSYFKSWSVAIVTRLLKNLYIFLWTLLFIIPGTIAKYKYSMTSFILAENPELSPSEAIARSKDLMDGYKWDLFCLEFSFIGWDILCVLTLGILCFWVIPYKHAAMAAFYRSLVPVPLEVEDEPEYQTEAI